MASRSSVISAVLLVLLVCIGVTLAVAPLYKPYTAAECTAAYARAHTRADTARIDLHRQRTDSPRDRNDRCGSVRAVAAQPAAGMLVP